MLKLAKFLVRQPSGLKLIFWVLGVFVGLVQAWAYRFSLSSEDAVSYLDIGDAYLRGDWHRAINAYWSPLYSWLLGFFIAILQPPPYWEFFVVKLVNLFIFLVAFASFDFFLQQLIKYQRKTQQTTSKRSRLRFSSGWRSSGPCPWHSTRLSSANPFQLRWPWWRWRHAARCSMRPPFSRTGGGSMAMTCGSSRLSTIAPAQWSRGSLRK